MILCELERDGEGQPTRILRRRFHHDAAPYKDENGQRLAWVIDDHLAYVEGENVDASLAAWQAAQASAQAAAAAEAQRVDGIRAHALLQEIDVALAAATPATISTYVDNNVTDLASARTMMKRILLYLAARRQGRV